jgi:hypothetical protein
MIRFLVRLLGSREGISGSGRGTGARRFAPQLEALDGRALPSAGLAAGFGPGVAPGEAMVRIAEPPSAVTPFGGSSGGVLGGMSGGVLGGAAGGIVGSRAALGALPIGEEIPTLSGRPIGEEIPSLLTRHIGEEIPQ